VLSVVWTKGKGPSGAIRASLRKPIRA